MAEIYLVRHGSNDYLGHGLAGRLPGVSLNEKGRVEARWIAETLANRAIERIISSPMERCRETAEPLSKRIGIPVELAPEVLEFDFGEWSGASLAELKESEVWARFNTYRSGTRPPKGESMLEVQTRMVGFLERLCRDAGARRIAVFSHGDPIRSALCYFLGIPLDLLTRLEVSPGSYSVLQLETWGPQVLAINRLP